MGILTFSEAYFFINVYVSSVMSKYNATTTHDRQTDTWADKTLLHSASQANIGVDFPLPTKRDSFYAEHETQLDSQLPSSGLSLYGQDSSLSGVRSSALGRPSIVTNVSYFNHIYIF